MEFASDLPQFGTPARSLFEKTYHEKDILRLEGIKLDEKIVRLEYIFRNYGMGDDFSQLCDLAIRETNQQLAVIEKKPIDNWNDYFRLLSRIDTVEVTACAPVLYSDPKLWKERLNLVDGLAGIYVERLKSVLSIYDNEIELDNQERAELTGVINEQTALALLNRDQVPSRVATPSSTLDDLKHNTDIDLLRMTNDGDSYLQHLQIKTSHYAHRHGQEDSKVVYIYADSMHNYGNNFACSRSLVRECRGTGSKADIALLNHTSNKLINIVNSHPSRKE